MLACRGYNKENSILSSIYFICYLVSFTSCWQYFTPITDIILTGSVPDEERVHSEYRYGDCKNEDKILYAHAHMDHMDILGKIIVRGWLDIKRIPTCIVLRAMAYPEDMFSETSYHFQICVPRITYAHTRHRFKYYYYEWYLPYEMKGGMNWDFFFYGPPSLEWQ